MDIYIQFSISALSMPVDWKPRILGNFASKQQVRLYKPPLRSSRVQNHGRTSFFKATLLLHTCIPSKRTYRFQAQNEVSTLYFSAIFPGFTWLGQGIQRLLSPPLRGRMRLLLRLKSLTGITKPSTYIRHDRSGYIIQSPRRIVELTNTKP